MRKYRGIGPAILALFLTAGAGANPTFKETLVKRLTEKKYDQLKSMGLLKTVEMANRGETPCHYSDAFSPFEKTLLSDAVVVGKIVKAEFLYRDGGPFRTEFEIEVAEVLSGKVPGTTVKVLSRFGPNSRDHRRWRSNLFHFELEPGDKAIFYLEKESLTALAEKFPDRALWLEDKFTFLQNDMAGTLILDPKGQGDRLDAKYLEATGRKGRATGVSEIRRSVLNASFYLGER